MTAIVPARVNGAYAPPDLVEMPMASMGCRPLPTTVSASPRQPHVPCHEHTVGLACAREDRHHVLAGELEHVAAHEGKLNV